MKAAGKKRVGALALAAFLAACASIPTINFEDGGGSSETSPPIKGVDGAAESLDGGGSSAAPDGGAPFDVAAPPVKDAAASDARTPADATAPEIDAGEDGGPPDQDGDDGGEAGATILCGSTLVSNCAGCDAGPLRCKRGNVDQCISDCSACGADWYPCLHCPTNKGLPRGTCLPLNASGQIENCQPTNSNLCPCTKDTDCTVVQGSAEVCEPFDAGKSRCLACGTATTDGLTCVSASGVQGTCAISPDASPACE